MQTRRCYGTVREGIAENVVVAMVGNAFFAADVDEIATWTDSANPFLSEKMWKTAARFIPEFYLAV